MPRTHRCRSKGTRLPPLLLWGIALLAIAYPAYRSYRRGTPAGTETTFKAKLRSRLSAFGIILVLTVMVYDIGDVHMRWADRTVQAASCIEGKYRAGDGLGSTAEFQVDGTLLFVSGGQHSVTPRELRLSNCHMAMILTRF